MAELSGLLLFVVILALLMLQLRSFSRTFMVVLTWPLGIIGVANQGHYDMTSVASENIVALCDVDDNYAAKKFKQYAQAKQFKEAVEVTGVIITKLDGTSKGGMVVAIHKELGLPIKFVGLGEQPDDLQPFDARQFAEALFSEKE